MQPAREREQERKRNKRILCFARPDLPPILLPVPSGLSLFFRTMRPEIDLLILKRSPLSLFFSCIQKREQNGKRHTILCFPLELFLLTVCPYIDLLIVRRSDDCFRGSILPCGDVVREVAMNPAGVAQISKLRNVQPEESQWKENRSRKRRRRKGAEKTQEHHQPTTFFSSWCCRDVAREVPMRRAEFKENFCEIQAQDRKIKKQREHQTKAENINKEKKEHIP